MHQDLPAPKLSSIAKSAEELILANLATTDTVLIQTANSIYRFTLSDPAQRRGRLSGGVLGEQDVNAIFLGGIAARTSQLNNAASLSLGNRALFVIEQETGVRRMVTSSITRLAHAKGEWSQI